MVAQGRHIAQVHLTHKLYMHCTMLYTTLFCQKSDIATPVNPQICIYGCLKQRWMHLVESSARH